MLSCLHAHSTHHFMKDQVPNSLKSPYMRRLMSIGVSTLVAWAGVALVLFKLDPYETIDLSVSLFFISLFFALMGTFTLILFVLKRWKASHYIALKHVNVSLRQGFLLSVCALICAGLLMLGLLRIWNGLLIVILITLIEFYWSSRDELD